MQRTPDNEIQEQESSILADPYNARIYSDGHSQTSSQDRIVRVPYFDENYTQSNASPRILINNSNSSECYSYNGWEEIDKQSNVSSEDLCREVRCIETEELSSKGAGDSNLSSHVNHGFPEVKAYINGDGKPMESPSTPSENNRGYESFPWNNDAGTKESMSFETVTSKESQEMTPVSLQVDKESPLPPSNKEEKELCSIHILNMSPQENLSLEHELGKDSSLNRRFKLTRSRSCKATIAGSLSPWFNTVHFNENTPSLGSERESVCFDRKLSPLSFELNTQSVSRKDFLSSSGDSVDIKIDTLNTKFATDTREKFELPTENLFMENPVSYVFVLFLITFYFDYFRSYS